MEYVLKDFGKQLKKKHLEMRRYFSPKGTDCYRVYDRNSAAIPAAVDIYGTRVCITDYRDGTLPGECSVSSIIDTVSRMLYFSGDAVVYKSRSIPKGRNQYTKAGETGSLQAVHENNLTFLVNLTDYIDTGLFLDHRKTREMIRNDAAGKRVLNLFAYTGAFSVYAAAGGAEEVDTVDLSGNYLRWAQENFACNDLAGERYRFLAEDAREYVRTLRNRGKRYDIIILDPPTFSNSRKMAGTFDVQRDYPSMIASCVSLLDKGGHIMFSTNYRKFHFDPGRLCGVEVNDVTPATIDQDFSRKRKPHRCWILRKRG